MENKMLKLLIQLFAEEESETTDYEDGEVLDTTKEDDVEEDTETTEPTEEAEQEESVEEPEKVKTFTQDEVNNMIESRIKRERNKLDKEYNSKLSKFEELAYLTKEGLNATDYDDALNKTRDFYGKQGIKYTPTRSAREDEILANADVQEILDSAESTDDIEKEVQKILSKGNNASKRETLIAQKLTDELTNKVRISELSKLGVKEDIYNSKEFKDFESKFNKNTPIADIYSLYRSKNKPEKVIENPGSMKSTPAKSKKQFITEAEYDKMSDKEIEENMDLIHESMLKW